MSDNKDLIIENLKNELATAKVDKYRIMINALCPYKMDIGNRVNANHECAGGGCGLCKESFFDELEKVFKKEIEEEYID